MHLYISVSYFVCAVSLTLSIRLSKPHLADWHDKYIISHRLHWMPLKLESFSRETTCLHANVSVLMAVTSLHVPLAIKKLAWSESPRCETDWPVTDLECRCRTNRPILITGRSIGESLGLRHGAGSVNQFSTYNETQLKIVNYVFFKNKIIHSVRPWLRNSLHKGLQAW